MFLMQSKLQKFISSLNLNKLFS